MVDKERRREYHRRWYEKNKEKIKQYNKKQYRENRSYWKEYGKKYKQRNKEKIKISHKEWYQKNKARCREKNKEWYQKNREKIKDHNQKPEIKARLKAYENKLNVKARRKIAKIKSDKKLKAKLEVKTRNNKRLSERRKNNPLFNLKCKLQTALWAALKTYSKTGKIMKSKDYGINYKAIIENLKPFPTNLSEYDIDHIIPLSWFDFNNPKEIKWAFAPENHQWLLKGKNRSKNNRFMG